MYRYACMRCSHAKGCGPFLSVEGAPLYCCRSPDHRSRTPSELRACVPFNALSSPLILFALAHSLTFPTSFLHCSQLYMSSSTFCDVYHTRGRRDRVAVYSNDSVRPRDLAGTPHLAEGRGGGEEEAGGKSSPAATRSTSFQRTNRIRRSLPSALRC